jgi:hypothetical protein
MLYLKEIAKIKGLNFIYQVYFSNRESIIFISYN